MAPGKTPPHVKRLGGLFRPGSLANTVAATRQLLARDGWKEYVAPLDAHDTLLAFKKGPQGLSVSFTIQVGKNDQTSEVTTVYYTPTRLNFALAIPADATDVVFDENRPYLSGITAGSADATLEFYRKELTARGWLPLTAADAAEAVAEREAGREDREWRASPTTFAERNGRSCCRCNAATTTRPRLEIKVPPFAEPQTLEGVSTCFGLPIPKMSKSPAAPAAIPNTRPMPMWRPKSAPCWRSIVAN